MNLAALNQYLTPEAAPDRFRERIFTPYQGRIIALFAEVGDNAPRSAKLPLNCQHQLHAQCRFYPDSLSQAAELSTASLTVVTNALRQNIGEAVRLRQQLRVAEIANLIVATDPPQR